MHITDIFFSPFFKSLYLVMFVFALLFCSSHFRAYIKREFFNSTEMYKNYLVRDVFIPGTIYSAIVTVSKGNDLLHIPFADDIVNDLSRGDVITFNYKLHEQVTEVLDIRKEELD